MQKVRNKFWALLPLIIFIIVYFSASLVLGDFYAVSPLIIFVAVTLFAFLQFPEIKFNQKLKAFSEGAGNETILLMILIFLLAGAFSQLGSTIGAVQSIVNITLTYLPINFIVPGFFLMACFISIAIGTSVGTIATLTPIAVEIEKVIPGSLALLLGAVIGGSMFGDNLSFISDTTIAATRTQNVSMKAKFEANFKLVLPAAIITTILFYFLSLDLKVVEFSPQDLKFDLIGIIPYIFVFGLSIFGLNVLWSLLIGILSFLILSLFYFDFSFLTNMKAINDGFISMFELSILCLVIGGLVGIIRLHGGIDYIIQKITDRIKTKRQAEFGIASLTSFVDAALANNTIAILIVGNLAKEISDQHQLEPKRVASILDTMSCFMQGVIPYGAQILVAIAAAKTVGFDVTPLAIIGNLYYPFLIGVSTLISIAIYKHPKQLRAK